MTFFIVLLSLGIPILAFVMWIAFTPFELAAGEYEAEPDTRIGVYSVSELMMGEDH